MPATHAGLNPEGHENTEPGQQAGVELEQNGCVVHAPEEELAITPLELLVDDVVVPLEEEEATHVISWKSIGSSL